MKNDIKSGKSFERLVEIMRRLLDPDGCPWDKEQTHKSLKPYVIEEAYEVCDAIDRHSFNDLKEELGDLALQIVFHAELARREKHFNISDILNGICEKLINRHPHVFGDVEAETSREVLANWEEIKKREKTARGRKVASILDGVPRQLPALAMAQRIQERAANVGFDWDNKEDVLKKVNEEWREFNDACRSGDHDKIEDEFGDLLFALVNLSRFANINAEQALRRTIEKFNHRFRHIEMRASQQGRNLSEMSLGEMDVFWDEAKSD